MTKNDNQLKRAHAKPYKVGKLYFGRVSKTRGSGWVVSTKEDLSNPVQTFEVGKQARFYCEDVREGTVKLPAPSDSIDINIPKGTGLTDIFADIAEDKII